LLEGADVDAVFLKPDWGDLSHHFLAEYPLSELANFDKIIEKAIQFSENLIIYLPRNTSIKDLFQRMAPFHDKLQGNKRRLAREFKKEDDMPEMAIEIERVLVGKSCKGLLVYTGDFARITPKEVIQRFVDTQCTLMPSSNVSKYSSGSSSKGSIGGRGGFAQRKNSVSSNGSGQDH
jgi:hypothetical protein